MARVSLPGAYRSRRPALLKKCFRREFKYYCKLAHKVRTEEFIDKIRYLANKENDTTKAVKIRANYLLEYITKNTKNKKG
jgi:hypothetical protein